VLPVCVAPYVRTGNLFLIRSERAVLLMQQDMRQ
jgi:hypothetical protein